MKINKIINYYKEHGMSGVFWRTVEKTTGRRPGAMPYQKWYLRHRADHTELQRQRTDRDSAAGPLFSIVVPLYRTPSRYLGELIDSIQQQTYGNWELCLADGSGPDSPLQQDLQKYCAQDSRIKTVWPQVPLGIAENTNAALKIASGDFIVFADHDDLLAPEALYECARCIREKPDTEMIYTDEDKISMDGSRHFDPMLKPDFSPDLLCSMNYICHLLVVKRSLQQQVGDLRSEYDGAQDHDFVLRCTEQTGQICHLPRVLYHWRCHEDSTAVNQDSKDYAFTAGVRAVQDHYDRIGIKAEVIPGEHLGLYRSVFQIAGEPLISIVIPNKDHRSDLERCIASIEEKSTYRNIEYIIIENNSEDTATFSYYQELQRKNVRVKIVTYEGEFNYSAINNFGVMSAAGDYLLFLNNDTELISPDGLREMLGICGRTDVGAVGARLYYGDDTIQHAGVIVGLGGIAGHAFGGARRSASGYGRRIICTQNLSAVTAACMLVKKTDFEQAGGFDEGLKVAFNDVDLCLKLRQLNKQIVYTPFSEWYHYESKSRGAEDTPEKIARFHSEIERFRTRWSKMLEAGDPYYNRNLTLKHSDFSLKRLPKE